MNSLCLYADRTGHRMRQPLSGDGLVSYMEQPMYMSCHLHQAIGPGRLTTWPFAPGAEALTTRPQVAQVRGQSEGD